MIDAVLPKKESKLHKMRISQESQDEPIEPLYNIRAWNYLTQNAEIIEVKNFLFGNTGRSFDSSGWN